MGATSFVKVGTEAPEVVFGPSAETAAASDHAEKAAQPARTTDWMRIARDCSVWCLRRGLDPQTPPPPARPRGARVLSARERADRVRDRALFTRSARARRSDARD